MFDGRFTDNMKIYVICGRFMFLSHMKKVDNLSQMQCVCKQMSQTRCLVLIFKNVCQLAMALQSTFTITVFLRIGNQRND